MGTSRRTCGTVPQPSELRFGVMRAVGRGIAVLDGVHIVQGKGEVLGVFVPHFHDGKCHSVADDEISVRQTYRRKARCLGFLAVYSLSRSTVGFMRNYQKINDCSTKT